MASKTREIKAKKGLAGSTDPETFHEEVLKLRTPLTAIRALTEILHDNPEMDREKRQQFLGKVVEESERLTRLTHEVLEMAKPESDSTEREMEQVNLQELIREGLTLMKSSFDATFDNVVKIQNLNEKMLKDMLEKGKEVQTNAVETVNDCIENAKKGRDEYRKVIGESFMKWVRC